MSASALVAVAMTMMVMVAKRASLDFPLAADRARTAARRTAATARKA
jgi:hypothetical protein